MIWVAYNKFGDLIADADSENDLLNVLARLGYDEYEVLIGVVTP